MLSTRTFIALGVVVAFSATAAAQGKTYRDDDLGFQVKTIDKWDQVPPEPTERETVARWASPREIKDLPARMLVHVFEKAGGTTGKQERPAFFETPMTLQRWLKYNRRGADLGKGRPLKVSAPKNMSVSGLLHEFERDSGYTLGGKSAGDFYTMMGVFESPHRTYVVEIFVESSNKRKYRGLFQSILNSFEFLESSAITKGADDAAEEGSGQSPKDRARERAKKEAEKVEGWWYVESENYVILTNLPKRRKGKIDTLRKELEAIRAHMEAELPPVRPIEAISVVRVCADRDTYLQYGAPPSSAGYWFAAAEELVLYAEGEKDRTREVLYHEAFHQYVFYAMGGVSPCICLNEGGADYYSGSEIQLGRVQKIEKVQSRHETIRTAIRTDGHVPIKEILLYSQAQYYSRADLCYAQGWSIVFFLQKGLVKGHPFEKILPTYYDTLRKEVLAAGDEAEWQVEPIRKKAHAAAFADVDLDVFEAAWKAFIVSGSLAKAD